MFDESPVHPILKFILRTFRENNLPIKTFFIFFTHCGIKEVLFTVNENFTFTSTAIDEIRRE